MENKIEITFFFLHRQFERSIILLQSDKKQFVIAPLLPATVTLFSIYHLIFKNLVYFNISILIFSLPLTFILTVASVYFIRDENIFERYRAYYFSRNQRKSSINYPETIDAIPIENLYRENFIKIDRLQISENIYLPQKNITSGINIFRGKDLLDEQTNSYKRSTVLNLPPRIQVIEKVDEVLLSDKQLQLIDHCFVILKRNIINQDITLKDFIKIIKYANCSSIDEVPYIKLDLHSKHIVVFLHSFYIPFIENLTNHKLSRSEAANFFRYKIKNDFRKINLGSISKTLRQVATKEQKSTYTDLLYKLTKSMQTYI